MFIPMAPLGAVSVSNEKIITIADNRKLIPVESGQSFKIQLPVYEHRNVSWRIEEYHKEVLTHTFEYSTNVTQSFTFVVDPGQTVSMFTKVKLVCYDPIQYKVYRSFWVSIHIKKKHANHKRR